MMLRSLALFCLAFVAVIPAASAQTPDERRRIDWVLERGRTLFALDRAAWVGTDDLRAHVPDLQAAGVRGYVVDRDDQGYVVIFYGDAGGRLEAVYRGRVGTSGIASREVFQRGQRPPLTAVQQRLARAQLLVGARPFRLCGNCARNIALVPPATPDGPIDAYVMTPQTSNDAIPFGGHHRLTIAADGTISGERAFTNSCLSMPLPRPGDPRRPVALGVSHLLDPLPTEIHVFSSMAAGLPVAVGTSRNGTWMVTSDSIRRLDGRPR